ncbi:MAG: L-glutamate gamma-semialdehyde dehydrogenase [Deltaproteobacteria bacterium]|nr:L-glutamate gamma-semialdehyde dehydrogenase [Deltaproteobacteria bacterium]
MANSFSKVPIPSNEPILSYAPGSPEKAALKARLDELCASQIEIPAFIGGKKVRTGKLGECRCPHEHSHKLAVFHKPGKKELETAIKAAMRAREDWSRMPFEARASIFLKAADLLAGPWRSTLNAATMLGQSKNAFQAEIDSACELIDFFRFNVHFMEQIYTMQPDSGHAMWDRLQYRPLDGFVLAVTPFNFTSIAGNLPTAPAIMGNTVVWKPASTAVFPAYFLMKLFEAAGLPPGVINMVPAEGRDISSTVVSSPHLAGLHFTGSTGTFVHLWKQMSANLERYGQYPRIVGETGGKDFIFAHRSADIKALATAMVRGAFEYQGQKCSAASRAYIPKSLWPKLEKAVLEQITRIKIGDVRDFSNFMNAVIDKASFEKIRGYINGAKRSKAAEIITGGKCDDGKGYFIEPTIIQAKDPKFKTMTEEIFGPVLSIYVYPDREYEETLRLCDKTSPYGLTGAVFGTDRKALQQAEELLSGAAGNFYINDKPTGAVVGQQPFGGSRFSGTNDKAGSMLNMLRWTSVRTIKENFLPPTDFTYPFMAEE